MSQARWQHQQLLVDYRGGRRIPLMVRSSIFVDASSSYAVTERLRLTLEAQNLTNEWAAQYSDSRRKDPLYQTLTGRTYTLGASYRF
jgi:outer membrane receptor protein involved in Fe transport